MSLPSAVKAKGEMARLLHAQNNDASQSTPVAPAAAITDSAVVDPQPVVPAPVEKPAQAAPEHLMDYETRFKNMRAKGDIRSKELTAKLEVANNTIAQLQAEVERLKSAAPVSSKANLFTDQQREELGDDAADAIEKMQSSYLAKIADLEAKINAHSVQPTEVVQRQDSGNTLELEFYKELDTLAPAWKETNADKHFFAWLAQIDPQTGNARQDDLTLAQDAYDAVSVARFVNTYLAQRPRESTVVEPHTSRATDYVASGAATPEGFELVYSGDEVKEFYDRKSAYNRQAMGGRGNADVKAQLDAEEAQIKQAFADGRVRD